MAHRPSAIAAVNKVLILHGGTVAAFGRKEEVLAAAMQSNEPGQGQGQSQTANLFAALAAATAPPPQPKPAAPSVFRAVPPGPASAPAPAAAPAPKATAGAEAPPSAAGRK